MRPGSFALPFVLVCEYPCRSLEMERKGGGLGRGEFLDLEKFRKLLSWLAPFPSEYIDGAIRGTVIRALSE